MAEQDDRAPNRPLSLRSPWTVAWLGLAVAVPDALWTLLPDAGPVSSRSLLAVLLGLVAAESFTVHFEFRKQGFTWSPSELAFVMALVAVGGAWTAVARAAAIGVVVVRPGLLATQGRVQRQRRGARGLRRGRRPPGPAGRRRSPSPPTWLSYLVAVVAASLLGAVLIAAAITATQGYPGRTLWTTLLVPVLLVGPVSVVVGLAVLLLVSVTPWAWLLIAPLLAALGAALPPLRRRDPRGPQRRARLRLRPARGAGPARRGRHPADRPGRPRAAQRRPGGALAAALPRRGAAPGRLRRERGGLVRRPRRPGRRPPPPGRGLDRRARSSSPSPAPTTRRPRRSRGGGSPTCWARR